MSYRCLARLCLSFHSSCAARVQSSASLASTAASVSSRNILALHLRSMGAQAEWSNMSHRYSHRLTINRLHACAWLTLRGDADCIYPCVVVDRVAGCPKLSDPPWSLQGGSESFGTRAQAASGHG